MLACTSRAASSWEGKSPSQIQQGIISQFFDPLCFPEWDPSTNRVTYRLYWPPNQEHITLIERIPDLLPEGSIAGQSMTSPDAAAGQASVFCRLLDGRGRTAP
jgi:hypothetical protein